VLKIGLHFGILELAANEALCIEDTVEKEIESVSSPEKAKMKTNVRVVGVHCDLILGGVADQTLIVRE